MPILHLNERDVHYFISPVVKTNMYVMIEENEALIVDPHISEEVDALLRAHNIKKVTIFLTHEHPDHTCGIPALMARFETVLFCQRFCAEAIADKRNNRPALMVFVLAEQDKINGTNTAGEFQRNFPVYACHADKTFEKKCEYVWGTERFEFTSTPGHSRGSCCIVWREKTIFTGDSLIFHAAPITRFPGGSASEYNTITRPFLDSFAADTTVLPGHGEPFCMEGIR